LRYDNERGKGDHRHAGSREGPYRFNSPRDWMRDFFADSVAGRLRPAR
jgi:hypothetical protein